MVWYADQPANMLTFGDLPENSTGYFKSPPSERGTLNILSTCIFTLVLCVYTCLHLNILPHKATKWYQKKWGSKTIGILLGLLAPEIVVVIAVRQYYWADELFHSMRKKLDPPGGDVEQIAQLAPVSGDSLTAHRESSRKRNPWTRYHSHFALVGGFALEQDDFPANFMPDTHTRLTLTPNALQKLAEVEPTLIPDISEHTIKDKSKADWIAKTLACWQACWFIFQFLGRFFTSMTISLLELNTFLHALCCLVIYLAWWWKPLNIGEPELIKTNTEHTCKIWAWMLMNSKLGSYRRLELGSSEEQKGFLVHNKDLYRKGTSQLAHHAFDTRGLSLSEEPRSEDRGQSETQTEDAHLSCLVLMSPLAVIIPFLLIVCAVSQPDIDGWYCYRFLPLGFLSKTIRTVFSSGLTKAHIATHILFWPLPLLYLAARVYILVECFINISQLPPEVYHVPQWSQYIPHLGAG